MLGGTGFVGRAIVEDALARGMRVTVVNRGHRPLIPGATALIGDRRAEGGLETLRHGEWDIVIDTWSGAPTAVRDAASLLTGRAGHYTYISSRSVYTYPPAPDLTEDGPVVAASPDDGDDVDYPAAKRGGELAAGAAFGDRALLVRAGLILGPYEDIGRLPWWLQRIARGGPVLAPGPYDLGLQYIDVRDLAAWTLDAAVQGLGGAYNVVSPPGHTTMGELLECCVRATAARAELRWTDPEPILAAGVQPWTELPIWIPPGTDYDGMHRADVSKAVAAGLRCRPVQQTVDDTWAWLQSLGGEAPQRPDRPPTGLDPLVEATLLG